MAKKQSFKSLKRAPAYQLAEEALREMIMGGTLSPGEYLPVEYDLAEQLGVTRPTLREALRKLESSGLVVRGARRRLMVTAPSKQVASDAMRQSVLLHNVTYRELWEVSMSLEPTAAELAAERIDEDLLAQIEENLRKTKECLDNTDQLIQADIEFHYLITAAAGNHALLIAGEPFSDLLLPAYGRITKRLEPGKRMLEAHEKIFEALKKRDGQMARRWMARHIKDFIVGCEMAGLPIDEPMLKRNGEKS